MYKVRKEKNVIKELEKIKKKDTITYGVLLKRLDLLEITPFPTNKKHVLSSNGISLFCELSYKSIRIYYMIFDGEVIIEKINYEGLVEITDLKKNHKSGNKNNYSNQRKFINLKKKKFKKRKN